MTLKDELEILRGEPIEVFDGDPMDIPCVEMSDTEKLCKHPVVSVQMCAYNHEPYIRQAIEGVMMQQTDFEFELVIGEDCSQDKTREICFEYQKKYPDKIRVLWWHENVSKLGGNSRRVQARCRGEFIALCEGDDYWIDPLKLQKQVDVMRKYPNVGLCFCGAKIYSSQENKWNVWNEAFDGFSPGLIKSRKYILWTMLGRNPYQSPKSEFWQMTVTFMFRLSILSRAQRTFDLFRWKLYVSDSIWCIGVGALSDVYYIADNVAVYRQMSTGVTLSKGAWCGRDTLLVRLYYYREVFKIAWFSLPQKILERYIYFVMGAMGESLTKRREYIKRITSKFFMDGIFRRIVCRLLLLTFYRPFTRRRPIFSLICRVRTLLLSFDSSKELDAIYTQSGAIYASPNA